MTPTEAVRPAQTQSVRPQPPASDDPIWNQRYRWVIEQLWLDCAENDDYLDPLPNLDLATQIARIQQHEAPPDSLDIIWPENLLTDAENAAREALCCCPPREGSWSSRCPIHR